MNDRSLNCVRKVRVKRPEEEGPMVHMRGTMLIVDILARAIIIVLLLWLWVIDGMVF
jgi:hypothetical protein